MALTSTLISTSGVAAAGSELQFLLRGVAREQFIEGGRFVVSQVAVCGSGHYLAIEGGFCMG
uniref:Uncharacterized protein n=1 Tax=Romanomermis culicivorax TaxID=13658 RepID=A0A915L1N1_ROMCU